MGRQTFDPVFQKVFAEAINTENRIRVKWYADYAKKQAQKSELVVEEQRPDVVEYLEERSREKKFVYPSVNGTCTLIRVVDPSRKMMEVPRKTRNVLYDGISRDDKGRAKYLKLRKQIHQDDKYITPICSSWDYGWKYDDQKREIDCDDPDRCQIEKKCTKLLKFAHRQ